MSSFSKHWKFVEEISAPFREKPKSASSPQKSNVLETEQSEFSDIQRELEAKFDELFGECDFDDDDDDDDDNGYNYDDSDFFDDDDDDDDYW